MKDLLDLNKQDLPGGIPCEWRDVIMALRDRLREVEARHQEFVAMVIESLAALAPKTNEKAIKKTEVILEAVEEKKELEPTVINCETKNIISKAAKMFGKRG